MSTESVPNLCLFCASPCPPTFNIVDGTLSRVKADPVLITAEHGFSYATSVFPSILQDEKCPFVAEQLEAILILRQILGIRKEKLCDFLGKLDGQLNPEFWVKVCESCAQHVRKYYEALKEISKLEKRKITIANLLRKSIQDTRNAGGAEATGSVWKEVRDEVLIVENEASDEPRVIIGIHNEIDEVYYVGEREYPPILRTEPLLADKNQNEVVQQPKTRSKSRKRDTSRSYECISCNFPASTQEELITHLELHQPGSKPARCKSCSWFLPRGKMKSHWRQYHPELCPGGSQRTEPPFQYRTCVKCGHEFCQTRHVKKHMKLHEEGKGEVCLDCGWLVRNLNFHFADWHPKEGSKKSELRKRTEKYPVVVRPAAYNVMENERAVQNEGNSMTGDITNDDDNAHFAEEDSDQVRKASTQTKSKLRKRTGNYPLFNAAKSRVGKKKRARKIPNEEIFITGDIPNDDDNGHLANIPLSPSVNAPEPSTGADIIPDKQPTSNESSLGPIKRFPLPGLLPEQFPRYSVFRDPSLDPTSLFYKCLECCYQGTTRHKLMNHLKLHQPGSGEI